jgi:ferredoxin-NADP reductase
MARAAVLGRLTWLIGRLISTRDETATARTLVLDVPGWFGHLPGQHVDVRLTAEDGYSTERSYSIASAPDGTRVELTIERLDDGEVSPYLTEILSPGDPLELRGPIGGYFAWHADSSTPVLLIGGGSGVVPLMAMARTWITERSKVPMRLIYSTRSPDTQLYAGELAGIGTRGEGLTADIIYTRSAPPGWAGTPGRLDASRLQDLAWRADPAGQVFVCGPTGFVESIARALTSLGFRPGQIRTERFGPSGG